jgi:putative ABC transport system permease protein
MSARVPLAWLLLIKMEKRLLVAIAGVAFAVVLALVQLAFQDALYTSVNLLYSHLNAELVVISPAYQSIVVRETFPERRLYQALAVDGVDSISPLYMDMAQWTDPVSHQDRFIFLVGFRPRPGVFDLPAVNSRLAQIAEPGGVLFDEGSRPEFGPVEKLFRENGTVATELSRRHVDVVGLFRVGASFANSGNVITSDTNFLQVLPFRRFGNVDLGLIKLKPGTNAEAVLARLQAILPDDVTVLTKQGFLEREKSFWDRNLPIGFIFRASLMMGLIVGAVIVYQILYSGISEHLAEFATLKAIGYSDARLFRVVLQEALILSVLGYVPGVLLALAVYRVVQSATFLPIGMTLSRLVLVYVLTVTVCIVSALLAVQRLRSADPAEIF